MVYFPDEYGLSWLTMTKDWYKVMSGSRVVGVVLLRNEVFTYDFMTKYIHDFILSTNQQRLIKTTIQHYQTLIVVH
jgi:hypothetical protein